MAKRAREATPTARRSRARFDEARARMTPEQRDHIDRFAAHQAGRDRGAEHRAAWVASTVLRLLRLGDEVARWPLSALPDFPEELPYAVQWRGRYFRLGASGPVGVVGTEAECAGFEHEVVYNEVGVGSDPLREYEREAGPHQLPDDGWRPS